jgi:glucokinase
MKENLLGIDIGGTKCAVIYGKQSGDDLAIVDKEKFATTDVNDTIDNILTALSAMMTKHGLNAENTAGVGISCGGPLSSSEGVVMSPPNLVGWDNIPIVRLVEDRVHISAHLQNDANACAYAEWKYGAGKGTRDMVFLTMGTGLGAGLIIDGRLYSGANDNAGEAGHISLSDFGPVGYGKRGSFEGFASGGGIAQIAQTIVKEHIQRGEKISWIKDNDIFGITAKDVSEAAKSGDELAIEVFELSGEYLGRGLSILIDIINPELIVIGSMYVRCEQLLKPSMEKAINRYALSNAAKVCRVVPALLGEKIGDIAALSLATLKS